MRIRLTLDFERARPQVERLEVEAITALDDEDEQDVQSPPTIGFRGLRSVPQ